MEPMQPPTMPRPRSQRVVRVLVGAVAGMMLLCIVSTVVFVVLKGPGLYRQSRDNFVEWARLSTRIGTQFGVPCQVGESRFRSNRGAGTKLNVVFGELPDERLGGRSRTEFAREVTRYARSLVGPGSAYTHLCVVFSTVGRSGLVTVRRSEPHCTDWAAIEGTGGGADAAPDAGEPSMSVAPSP